MNEGGWEHGGPWGGDNYFSPYGNPNLPDGPSGEFLPERLARETVQFIEAQRGRAVPRLSVVLLRPHASDDYEGP